MSKLTPEMRSFLTVLKKFERPVTRSQLCKLTGKRFASTTDMKARQMCKSAGFAVFVDGCFGMGWEITPAGRAALEPQP